ncbi:MAG: hypothetical protein ACMUIM_01175 [bacterium]
MSARVFRCWAVTFLFISFILFFLGNRAVAFDVRGGETISIPAGEIVDEDLYAAGETIIIDGTINGDLWAFGRAVVINGDVKGSVLAAAETIHITGHLHHTIRAMCRAFDMSGQIDADVMVFAAEVNVAAQSGIGGDLLFGSSKTNIDGPVGSDILGGAGDIRISDVVYGNVKLRVKHLTLSPSANIQGDLIYSSEAKADIQSGARVAGAITYKVPVVQVKERHPQTLPFLRIMQKVMSFIMALITGMVIILIAPKRLNSVSDAIGSNPWPSFGWGAVILFATPLATLTVFFTILGIPVAMIALALYLIAIYLSQIPVGLFLGRWIIRRFFQVESKAIMVGALALGLSILVLLRLIPFLGFFVGVAVILLGIGAMVVSEKNRRMALRVSNHY